MSSKPSVMTVTAGGCWWSLVVDGHLVLLLAIVKRGYWKVTLPLWQRSMRFDDVVMDTKWLFKEVEREHLVMFLNFSLRASFTNKIIRNAARKRTILICHTKNENKRWTFIASVCSGRIYTRTSQNLHHCRDNISTSKHVFFKTRRLFVASPM